MTDADFLRALTHGPRFIPEVEARIRAIADRLDVVDARERSEADRITRATLGAAPPSQIPSDNRGRP